jgi:AraC-like DNA-binding protein/ligand-binding sensor protein
MQTTFAKPTPPLHPLHAEPDAGFGNYATVRQEQQRPLPVATALTAGRPAGRLSNWNGDKNLIDALTGSKFYQDYERAFTETTGLVVALRPVESWQMPHHGKRHENPFCALMAQRSRSCAACLQVQQRLTAAALHEAQTVACLAGLSDTAVPVRLGDRLIGFLQTGQVFLKPPTLGQFERVRKRVSEWGVSVDAAQLKAAYFGGRVVPQRQHAAVVKLLSIFAQHLSMISNQLMVQHQNTEPPVIARAKEFVRDHQGEKLSLVQVAQAVNTSTFYFCKMFKKVTGLNFTDYVARVRIYRAKNLLLNPNLRISEIAFEVGFQSLTHFNRVFKKIIGRSPTEYRAKLPAV